MSKLTTKERKKLPSKDFGLPEKKAFPLNNLQHARLAKAMEKYASPAERKEINSKIAKKYPSIDKNKKK